MTRPNYDDSAVLEKWRRIQAGEAVTINEEWHDAAIEYFKQHEGPDADSFFRDVATAPNPNRCGVYDGFIAYIGHPPCPCGRQHDAGERFFVSVRNEAGEQRLILGPYDTHPEALANVDRGRQLGEAADPRAVWYAFGTCGMDRYAADRCRSEVIFADQTHAPPPERRVHRQRGRRIVAAYRHR